MKRQWVRLQNVALQDLTPRPDLTPTPAPGEPETPWKNALFMQVTGEIGIENLPSLTE